MIEQDANAFLEHFGIKGQRWGVRNLKKDFNNRFNTSQQRQKYKNLAVGVGAGVGLTGAAVAVGLILKNKSNTKINSLPPLNQMWNYKPKSPNVKLKDLPPLNQMWNSGVPRFMNNQNRKALGLPLNIPRFMNSANRKSLGL